MTPRMDEDGDEISRRLLAFTLEIISLLSGEDYTIVRKTPGGGVTPIIHLQESGGRSQSPITEPPPHPSIHERKKILELSNKMIELLTGEVPIRCRDVAVFLSTEEWEYLEGHKDRYEEVMMEDLRPLTSRDGSRKRNPPERCPRPLCPQDRPEEKHNILESHQGEDLIDIKVEVVDGEQQAIAVWADQQDGLLERHLPERCARPPLNGPGDTEKHSVPESHQGEDPTKIKVENEEEEVMTRGDQPCVSDGKEEIPVDVSTGNPCENNGLSLNCNKEDIRKHSNGENPITLHLHPGFPSTSLSYNPPNHEEPSSEQSRIVTTISAGKVGTRFQIEKQFTKSSNFFKKKRKHKGKKRFSCSECGKYCISNGDLVKHRRIHTGVKPYSCSECGKSFIDNGKLIRHQRIHSGEKPYSCSECGKCFLDKGSLTTHQRSHTGEKPFLCLQCGRWFASKSYLTTHQRIHTEEKPYSCSLCRMSFTVKRYLIKHQGIHTGEKPFICSECDKCFREKSELVRHLRSHTGEKMFSCLQCGKCFAHKSSLVNHEKYHTDEKQHSCSECGKSFMSKSHLARHEIIHTGEKPYSCSLCGKCFTHKASLVVHKRIHTGEKPYSCSVCGKCVTHKSNLVKHERIHTGK